MCGRNRDSCLVNFLGKRTFPFRCWMDFWLTLQPPKRRSHRRLPGEKVSTSLTSVSEIGRYFWQFHILSQWYLRIMIYIYIYTYIYIHRYIYTYIYIYIYTYNFDLLEHYLRIMIVPKKSDIARTSEDGWGTTCLGVQRLLATLFGL